MLVNEFFLFYVWIIFTQTAVVLSSAIAIFKIFISTFISHTACCLNFALAVKILISFCILTVYTCHGLQLHQDRDSDQERSTMS